ncbi:shikimate dehydrogenase [Pelagibacterium montanilacus]|uniref:shikimate dehydrogenase n=1 Tax=Pelagibacterium montanilacus TaxID=2185280 RepID=UPI000F8F68F8|nr:shikimate dehydrogenase [Pelagibacterium montanilacus]
MARAFVIGHPIAHSKSPVIHRFWLDALGIEGSSYEAIDVAPGDLEGFIARLREGAFAGGNVTIPHKEAVLALCDDLDPLARRIGAVNTLVATSGRVMGHNTDCPGFLANLDTGAPGWSQGLERAIVLGAGGAARAIIVALIERGVPEIVILNRSPDRAHGLARELGAGRQGVAADGLEAYESLAPGTGLLVNTTAIGMGGSRFDALDPARLGQDAVVNDIVYTPLETELLQAAHRAGKRTVDGLGMLLHQAVPGFAAWFGQTPQVTPALRDAVLAAMGDKN